MWDLSPTHVFLCDWKAVVPPLWERQGQSKRGAWLSLMVASVSPFIRHPWIRLVLTQISKVGAWCLGEDGATAAQCQLKLLSVPGSALVSLKGLWVAQGSLPVLGSLISQHCAWHTAAPVITHWADKWMYESGPRSLTVLWKLKVESHFYRHSHF